MPKWRNGRRGGLKNRCQQWRGGSTPTFGTTFLEIKFPFRPAEYAQIPNKISPLVKLTVFTLLNFPPAFVWGT